MKFRAAVATAAAVPLALGLAACGTGGPAATGYRPSVPVDTPLATNTAAPAKPVAHLNRVTFVPAMNTALTKQKSWHLVYTMKVNGTTMMTMSGVQEQNPLAMSMDMSGAVIGNKTARLVLVDDVLYLSTPGVTPAGKYVEATGSDADRLRSMLSDGDPRKLSAALSSSASVRFAGELTVDGEKLDRYIITVDTTKALEGTKQQAPDGVPKTTSYEILMDSAHRVRQVHVESSGLSMNTTISEYNKPDRISAPPASNIVR